MLQPARRLTMTPIRLDTNGHYSVHGEFRPGQQAASLLLPGFVIDVEALFAVAKDVPE